MDEVVELVVVIPTSPRSSKIEYRCKSYYSLWPGLDGPQRLSPLNKIL
jgi:hypothetical protein